MATGLERPKGGFLALDELGAGDRSYSAALIRGLIDGRGWRDGRGRQIRGTMFRDP
ncbi:MAG: hypothetical protein IPK66_12270 [Rhodospirillales bacterium]|nr:hypothetical protein [Rhodospirillales bacterium]